MTVKDIYGACAPRPIDLPTSATEYMYQCSTALGQLRVHQDHFRSWYVGGYTAIEDGEPLIAHKPKAWVGVSPLAVFTLMMAVTSASEGVFLWNLFYGVLTGRWIMHWSVALWGAAMCTALFLTIAVGLIKGSDRKR